MSELGFIVVCWVGSFCLGWVLLCFAVSWIMIGYCFFLTVVCPCHCCSEHGMAWHGLMMLMMSND